MLRGKPALPQEIELGDMLTGSNEKASLFYSLGHIFLFVFLSKYAFFENGLLFLLSDTWFIMLSLLSKIYI